MRESEKCPPAHLFDIEGVCKFCGYDAKNQPPAPATPMQKSTFDIILDEMRTVHDKKSADYANPQDRFSNFTEAANEAGCSVDTVFRVLIGIKNSRIKQLMNSGAAPKNESLEDSILDRTVYGVLWMAWRREHGTD